MKKHFKLIIYLACCGILVSASLFAGRNAYQSCDKCHLVFQNKGTASNILTGLYKSYPAGIKP